MAIICLFIIPIIGIIMVLFTETRRIGVSILTIIPDFMETTMAVTTEVIMVIRTMVALIMEVQKR